MKLVQFKHYLQQTDLDMAYFCHPDPALTYFTQFYPSQAVLLVGAAKTTLFLSKLDKKPSLKNINIMPMERDWQHQIKSASVQKIGINKNALTIRQGEDLRKIFPRARLIDVSQEIIHARKEKTVSELRKISKACQITSSTFNAVVQELRKKSFQTEQDVAFFMEKTIKEHDAGIAFPTIVAMGKNAAIPHHKTSSAKLGKGFLLLDFGACYRQYCADMTRVVYLGVPDKEEKQMYGLLLEAQQTALNSIKEGKPFHELDAVVRKKLGNYSSYFIHSLGHGIGLEVHEAPRFFDEQERIQKNVPFTIEPGIYFPGKFGLRIEDTVLFNGKTQVLTTAPKELICIK